jgi:hypothetical protein
MNGMYRNIILLLYCIRATHEDASYAWPAVRQNHRGTEFTETLRIPFHPSLKSPLIASGIVVSVRSSSVRSATLWFYSRKPPGFHHRSMLPPQSHRGEQFPLSLGPFVLRVLVVYSYTDRHGNNRSKSF